jgi:hypothetical protein
MLFCTLRESLNVFQMKTFDIPEQDEYFRDHFSGVSEDGKRNWFY